MRDMRPGHAAYFHDALMSTLVTYARAPHKLALVIETRRNPARSLSRRDHGDIARTPAKPETIKLRLKPKARRARIRNSSSLVNDDNPVPFRVNLLQRPAHLVLGMRDIIMHDQLVPLGPGLVLVERGPGQLTGDLADALSASARQGRVITLIVDDEHPVIGAERQDSVDDKVRLPAAILPDDRVMRRELQDPLLIDPAQHLRPRLSRDRDKRRVGLTIRA